MLPQEQRVRVAFNNVAPGYFSTLGIPLLAGRDFDDRDRPDSARVAIISQRMASHFDGSPIGQRLGGGPKAREVVGVVGDVRYASVRDLPRDVVYFPLFQQQGKDMFYSPTFEIRFAGRCPAFWPRFANAVARVDPALTLFRIRTLERQTEDSFARERLLAVLTSYFGGFAVLLACIGLYGLMSYSITLRTPEIGLRMALGARPASVAWLAVRETAWTVLAGAVAGTAGAYAAVESSRASCSASAPRSRRVRRRHRVAPDHGRRRRLLPRPPGVADRSAGN